VQQNNLREVEHGFKVTFCEKTKNNIMKKIKGFKLLSITLLLLSSGLVNANISLGFGSGIKNAGSIDIDVTISGLGNGEAYSLSSYDLDIIFNSSHLSFSSAAFGDPLLGNQLDLFDFGLNEFGASLTGTGLLNIYEISFDDSDDLNEMQALSFTLATLTFDILKPDVSQLHFFVNDLGDASNNYLGATSTIGTVSTVPVPAAFWFMASGLVVLYRKR